MSGMSCNGDWGGLLRFSLHETETAGAIQGTTLRSRDYRPLRSLVPAISAELAAIGRNDGRAQSHHRSRHDLALGAAIRAGTGPALPSRTAE